MFYPMKRLALVLLLGLAVWPAVLFAQGAYLDKGVNGFGAETRLMLADGQFAGLGITSGYSIAGVLDIGGRVDATLDELGGEDATDLRVAFDYRINVVKQSRGVPVSLQIAGSYGFNNVVSDYLVANSATRRGSGYSIGLNLASNIPLTPVWFIRVNLLGDYASTLYTTVGSPLAGTERVGGLRFGGGLGLLVAFPAGPILVLQAEMRADPDLELQIHPVLAAAFPRR